MSRTPPERLKKKDPNPPKGILQLRRVLLTDLKLASARATLIEMRSSCYREITERRLDPKLFGQALRQLRKDANLSLREMGGHLKLSAPFLCDVENGFRNLKLTAQVQYVDICLQGGKRK